MMIRKQLEPFPGPWKGRERERPWDSGCMGFTVNMCVCQRERETETESVSVCVHTQSWHLSTRAFFGLEPQVQHEVRDIY